MKEQKEVWPPPLVKSNENIEAAPIRLYLTRIGWLDAIAGIGTGLFLGLFLQVVSINCIFICFHYLIPKWSGSYWEIIAFSLLASLLLSLIWVWARSFYRRLANCAFWSGIALIGLMYWFCASMWQIENTP